MSQEKVAQNKELKKNRKKIVRKNKIKAVVWSLVGLLAAGVLVGWLGFSGYTKYTEYEEENKETVSTPISLEALSEYVADLSADEDEADEEDTADDEATEDEETTDEDTQEDAE